MTEKTLMSQASYLMLGETAAFVIKFFVPIILVRIFSQTDYGLYQQALLIFFTLMPMIPFGMNQSLYYFYSREKNKRGLLWQNFLFLFTFGLIALIIIITFRSELATVLNNPELTNLLILSAAHLFFMLCSSFLEVIMIVEGNSKLASIITTTSTLIRTGLILGFALITKDVSFILLGLLIFSIVRFTWILMYLMRKYNPSGRVISLRLLKQQWVYSWPFGVSLFLGYARQFADKYIVSFFFTPAMFAVYAVGANNIPLLGTMFTSVNKVTLPIVSKLQKEDKKEDIIIIWHKSVRKLALVAIPVFVYTLIVAKEIIFTLFTDKYASAVPIFMVYIFLFPRDVFMHGLITRAYAATKYILKAGIFVFIFTMVMLFLMTKYFGIVGAAIANVSGLYMMTFLQVMKGKSLLRLSFRRLLPWKSILKATFLSVVAAVPVIIIKTSISMHPIIILILSAPVFFMAYLYMLFKYQIITMEEKKRLIHYIRKKIL